MSIISIIKRSVILITLVGGLASAAIASAQSPSPSMSPSASGSMSPTSVPTYPSPSISPTVTMTPEMTMAISQGQQLYKQLVQKQISCSNLSSTDLAKIGQYLMHQQIGNTDQQAEVNMMMNTLLGGDGMMKVSTMMGEHATGCNGQ